jgi:hypothetical protein
MISLYAYSYPGYDNLSECPLKGDYVLVKFGDTTRTADLRMSEQGGAAEAFAKITVGTWPGCDRIKRDFEVHHVLKERGLDHKEGAGTEWFWIPGKTYSDAYEYLDQLVTEMEGHIVRKKVKLRTLQQKALDETMDAIDNGADVATVIANLCPRFGKTIWALMLFKQISEKYGNRIMLLPAYWLSVHSSFEGELEEFDDFQHMTIVDPRKIEDPDTAVDAAWAEGQDVIIPISLHGDLTEWKQKHSWLRDIDSETFFMFADEGDFGTHADAQIDKLDYILQ